MGISERRYRAYRVVCDFCGAAAREAFSTGLATGAAIDEGFWQASRWIGRRYEYHWTCPAPACAAALGCWRRGADAAADLIAEEAGHEYSA
jgi:hypothetical protein